MRRGPLTGTWSLLLLKPFKQRLTDVNSFRLSKPLCSRSVLFKRAVNFGSVFPNRLFRGDYDTKFPTTIVDNDIHGRIEKQMRDKSFSIYAHIHTFISRT